MADNPHFDLPFRFRGSSFVVVEQDSLQDIANCVEAALLTSVGFRTELPDFGTPDQTFLLQPLKIEQLVDQIILHEPRATIIAEQNIDLLNELAARVSMKVYAREEEATT